MATDQNKTTLEHAARTLFIRYYVERDGASSQWATHYWDTCAHADHKGDCPYAEHKGPITCDRCACDDFRFKAQVVMEAMNDATA